MLSTAEKKQESRANVIEIKTLRSMCDGLRDRMSVIGESCGMKYDIVTRIEKANASIV